MTIPRKIAKKILLFRNFAAEVKKSMATLDWDHLVRKNQDFSPFPIILRGDVTGDKTDPILSKFRCQLGQCFQTEFRVHIGETNFSTGAQKPNREFFAETSGWSRNDDNTILVFPVHSIFFKQNKNVYELTSVPYLTNQLQRKINLFLANHAGQ